MTLSGTEAVRIAAAALVLAAAAAVAAAPLVTITVTYASYEAGLLPPARPYLPLVAPVALLAAAAALVLARRHGLAAGLSAFAASYYLTLALAESLRAGPGRALVVPLAYNVFLVGPGRAEVSLLAAALAAASAVASALLAAGGEEAPPGRDAIRRGQLHGRARGRGG